MAQLYYMSLPGVPPWFTTIKQVGAQLGPYLSYLYTAIDALKSEKPILGWRAASRRERQEFERRLDERWAKKRRRARDAWKRRDRHVNKRPEGVWVVLEPPPWRPEEPESTFEEFLKAKQVNRREACDKESSIFILDKDFEGRAFLLPELPIEVEPPDEERGGPRRPTAARPFGPLLWLRPNTYTLERQRYALWDLESGPTPRHAPLIRLLTTQGTWPSFAPRELNEEDWLFLRPPAGATDLRDGTPAQRRFVNAALETPDFALLEGPPGSGKTTAICELIAQLTREGKRVLLVASTHVAVDNVLERLLEWQDDPATQE